MPTEINILDIYEKRPLKCGSVKWVGWGWFEHIEFKNKHVWPSWGMYIVALSLPTFGDILSRITAHQSSTINLSLTWIFQTTTQYIMSWAM